MYEYEYRNRLAQSIMTHVFCYNTLHDFETVAVYDVLILYIMPSNTYRKICPK